MKYLVILVISVTLWSCGSKDSKVQTNKNSGTKVSNGVHTPIPLGSTISPYGFYEFIPASSSSKLPLMVFLHGVQEKGNSADNLEELERVLAHGVPKMIANGTWTQDMIVISPQCHENGWDADKVHKLFKFVVENYNVDEGKIYLTGLSMGGIGTMRYIQSYGARSYPAAVVSICGGGNPKKAKSFKKIPVWAFHGQLDQRIDVNNSVTMIEAINSTDPDEKALLTIYPEVGHNSWDMTYDGSGMGQESSSYDSFSVDVFSWMLKHSKNN